MSQNGIIVHYVTPNSVHVPDAAWFARRGYHTITPEQYATISRILPRTRKLKTTSKIAPRRTVTPDYVIRSIVERRESLVVVYPKPVIPTKRMLASEMDYPVQAVVGFDSTNAFDLRQLKQLGKQLGVFKIIHYRTVLNTADAIAKAIRALNLIESMYPADKQGYVVAERKLPETTTSATLGGITSAPLFGRKAIANGTPKRKPARLDHLQAGRRPQG